MSDDPAHTTWTTWDQVHPGHAGWQEVAYMWLAADTVVFALAGYGLFFLCMTLLARGPADCFAPTAWRAVFVATGATGVVLALADVVENTIGHVVVATDGDVATDPPSAIRSFKWLVAALIGMVFVGGWVMVGVRWDIRSLRGS